MFGSNAVNFKPLPGQARSAAILRRTDGEETADCLGISPTAPDAMPVPWLYNALRARNPKKS